jgi:hypothetical protein
VDDLASPDPQVRRRAAEKIRDQHLYHATPREPWDRLAADLRVGMSAEQIIPILRQRGLDLTAQDFAYNAIYKFPLDESWVLACAIDNSVLTQFRVMEEPKEIRVDPPASYTGFWLTYRIDGTRASFSDCQKGRLRSVAP